MRLSILKQTLIIICFSTISCTIFAQQSKIDSLKGLLPAAKDTVYIKTLLDICWVYRNLQLDSAEKYCEEANILSQKNKHTYLFTLSLHYSGVVALNRGNTAQALDYYYRVLELAEQNGYTERLAFVYQGIGRINNLQKNYKQAIIHTNRSMALFEKLNDQLGISYCYLTLGEAATNQKKFKEGLFYYNQSLHIRQKLNNQSGIAAIYSLMGENEQLQAKYKESIDYLKKAEEIFSKLGDTRGMVTVLNRIGKIYMIQNDHKQAISYFEQSIKLARQTGITQILTEAYQNIAKTYAVENDYVKAYQYEAMLNSYKDSVLNEEKEKNAQEIEAKYRSVKREQAILSLKKANSDQRSLTYLSIIISLLMAAVGIVFYFNIRQKRKSNQLLLIQQKEIQEKNGALMRLNEEITLQNQEITSQRDEQEKINIFKDKLFSIISHDLRSPLASLANSLFLFKSKILSEEERNTLTEMLLRDYQATSYLLDNLLNWTRMQMQGLKINPKQLNLSELVRENFDLLKPQAEKKGISLESKVSDELAAFADLEMTKTVIRNLLHNAIKYSFQGGVVKISAHSEAENIVISIKDSGRGMSMEEQKKLFGLEYFSKYGTANEKGSGLGLLLCKDFTEKNKGTIWVESIENEGSTFSFTLPKSTTIPANL
jgi:two-component system, sensor histidine kinase and response regulator